MTEGHTPSVIYQAGGVYLKPAIFHFFFVSFVVKNFHVQALLRMQGPDEVPIFRRGVLIEVVTAVQIVAGDAVAGVEG